jgi:hypothetical protein
MDFNLFLLFLPAVLIGYYIIDLRGETFFIFIGVIFFAFLFVSGTTPISIFPFVIDNGTISFRNVTEDNQIQNVPVDNPVQETPIILPNRTEVPLNQTWSNDWLHRA